MPEEYSIDNLTKAQARAIVQAQNRLDFCTTFVNVAEASGDLESSGWNPNQIFCIGDSEPYQCAEKGRQEGHSFAFAADSVARAALEPRSMGVHISTDKWEAQKKQIYCLRIIDSLHATAKKFVKLISVSKNRLEFENGSLIDFLACRPPRGADRAAVYLDEYAFMPNPEQIMKAALGCTTHGGYIRAGSTHCGSEVEFYRIARNVMDEYGNHPYKYWSRNSFPWWSCPTLCIDVERALIEAPNMSTKERVEKFGNEKIKALFRGYPSLSDFQEEFECVVVDESHSFFPMALISSCHPPKGIEEWFEWVEVDGKNGVTCLDAAKDIIRSIRRACDDGTIRGPLYVAQDVGRHIDKDEISFGNEWNNSLCLRAIISMNKMPFQKKQELWHYIMEVLPITKGYIDATPGSMGEPMGEEMFMRYNQRAMPFVFNLETKAMLATNVKIMMERGGLILPQPLPSLIRQIHAIKKKVTLHGHITFNVDENKDHHGDKFWSLAMLCGLGNQTPEVFSFPIKVGSRAKPRVLPGMEVLGGLGGMRVTPGGILVPR